MKLIDKDALVAEIEKLHGNPFYRMAIKDVLSILDTLEVKEVDLEKEYDNEFFKDPVFGKLVNRNAGISIAKHFFELGLKVKQESNDDVKIGEAQIYLEDDGGEPPYDGKQWLDLSCTEYEIPKALFKDGNNVEILIRKAQKGE